MGEEKKEIRNIKQGFDYREEDNRTPRKEELRFPRM